MNQLHYVAYGSNLHPLRLQQRAPSASPLAVVHLRHQLVTFHKRSNDGSGKCNLTPDDDSTSYGVLYKMTPHDMTALDAAEGPEYLRQLLQVTIGNKIYTPTVYIARSESIDASLVPYCWYRDLVVQGARYFNFPASYVAALQGVPCTNDPDVTRVQRNQALLGTVTQYPSLSQALPMV